MIREIHKNRYKKKSASYCTGNKTYKIISSNCIEQKQCLAIQSYERKTPLVLSKFGDPYHHKCTGRNGRPKLIEIMVKGKWLKTSLCFFSDNSFISIFNSIKAKKWPNPKKVISSQK